MEEGRPKEIIYKKLIPFLLQMYSRFWGTQIRKELRSRKYKRGKKRKKGEDGKDLRKRDREPRKSKTKKEKRDGKKLEG